jgi:hypothetical protein
MEETEEDSGEVDLDVLIGVVSIGEFGKESDSEEVEFNF